MILYNTAVAQTQLLKHAVALTQLHTTRCRTWTQLQTNLTHHNATSNNVTTSQNAQFVTQQALLFTQLHRTCRHGVK